MTRSLIIGARGQDGRILSSQLAALGHQVTRVGRPGSPGDVGAVNVTDAAAVHALLKGVAPDHIYYLAAHHGAAEAGPGPSEAQALRASVAVHLEGWATVMEAAVQHAPTARLFYAASSHVFGTPTQAPQDERTPFQPQSIYAITKAAGVELGRMFRRRGLHVSCGILYNHESPLRSERFLSSRVCRGAAAARAAVDAGRTFEMSLGSLEARVDWGYAPDYTDAMRRMLEAPEAADFVVATGVLHSVAEFCQIAFEAVGLDWRQHVREAPGLVVAAPALVGDSTRLREQTGWRPSLTFEELVRLLVRAAQGEGGP